MLKSLIKLALYFEKYSFVKKASIASDLATRIMHSLVPLTMKDNPEEAKNTMVHLTDKHLLGIAERYLKIGTIISYQEMDSGSINNEATKNVLNLINQNDYLSALKIAIGEFNNDKIWNHSHGGKRWALFAKYLLTIGNAINNFKKAKQENDYDKMVEESNLISSYMNASDGLTHNTGSFLSKMINYEKMAYEMYAEFPEATSAKQKEKELDAINKLMDSKQLSNKEDVLPYIKQYMYGNPDNYLYREFFTKLISSSKPNPERAEKELMEIRKNKELISYIDKNIDKAIHNMINDLNKGKIDNINNYFLLVSSLADNYRFAKCKDKLKQILSKHVLGNKIAKPSIKEIKEYFESRYEGNNKEFVLYIGGGAYLILLNNNTADVKNISFEDANNLTVDKIYKPHLETNKTNEISKLKALIDAVKEMRAVIDVAYNIGLPSFS